MLRRLLFVSLAATVLYGWFVMVYPVLGTDNMRFWSLALGYTLGSLGSVFVVCRSAMSVWSTTIPAAAALLVVASFRNEAEVHAYLLLAGVTGFVYLASDSLPSDDDRRWRRMALLGVVAVMALAFGAAIVVALPWTQSRVEETMMTIYNPSPGGSAAQHRARARRASAAEAFEEGRDARLERAAAATPKSRVGPLRWHGLVARCRPPPRFSRRPRGTWLSIKLRRLL